MANFNLLQHPNGNKVAVKQGWSWGAFIFNIFYCLYRGLWGIALILLAIYLQIAAVTGGYYLNAIVATQQDSSLALNFYPSTSFIIFYLTIYLLICLFLGFFANSLRVKKLLRQGYLMTEQLSADSTGKALQYH